MSTLKDKARELLDGRLTALDDLEIAQQNLDLARARLADTEGQVMAAWDAAITAGWTPAELKRLGVTEPAKKRPGRPRGAGRVRRSSTTNSAATDASGTPASESPDTREVHES